MNPILHSVLIALCTVAIVLPRPATASTVTPALSITSGGLVTLSVLNNDSSLFISQVDISGLSQVGSVLQTPGWTSSLMTTNPVDEQISWTPNAPANDIMPGLSKTFQFDPFWVFIVIAITLVLITTEECDPCVVDTFVGKFNPDQNGFIPLQQTPISPIGSVIPGLILGGGIFTRWLWRRRQLTTRIQYIMDSDHCRTATV